MYRVGTETNKSEARFIRTSYLLSHEIPNYLLPLVLKKHKLRLVRKPKETYNCVIPQPPLLSTTRISS